MSSQVAGVDIEEPVISLSAPSFAPVLSEHTRRPQSEHGRVKGSSPPAE
jgi:hypothetical protein